MRPVVQQTRHWDEGAGRTQALRSKEDAYDYRYFLEPDLVPLVPDAEWIRAVGDTLGMMPADRRARLVDLLDGAGGATDAQRDQVATVVDLGLDDLVVEAVAGGVGSALALARTANEAATDAEAARALDPKSYVALLTLEAQGSLSATQAKAVLAELLARGGGDPAAIARDKGFEAMSEDSLAATVAQAVADHPDEWERYCDGDDKLAGFFTGLVMKATRGQANGKAVAAELAAPAGLTNSPLPARFGTVLPWGSRSAVGGRGWVRDGRSAAGGRAPSDSGSGSAPWLRRDRSGLGGAGRGGRALPGVLPGGSLGPYDILGKYGLTARPGRVHDGILAIDQITQMIPWSVLSWTQVHHGQIPLWNPYSALGMPLAFNWQSSAFSVPALIGYALPLRYVYTSQVLATLLIAGSGALRVRPGAAPADPGLHVPGSRLRAVRPVLRLAGLADRLGRLVDRLDPGRTGPGQSGPPPRSATWC